MRTGGFSLIDFMNNVSSIASHFQAQTGWKAFVKGPYYTVMMHVSQFHFPYGPTSHVSQVTLSIDRVSLYLFSHNICCLSSQESQSMLFQKRMGVVQAHNHLLNEKAFVAYKKRAEFVFWLSI